MPYLMEWGALLGRDALVRRATARWHDYGEGIQAVYAMIRT